MPACIRLIPQDNPVVALATALGYTIMLNNEQAYPRYFGDFQGQGIHENDNLVDLVADLIRSTRINQPTSDEEALTARIESQQVQIEQLTDTIRDLKRQLDLEHRLLIDTQARGFINFLERQPMTPFIQKMLANSDFTFQRQASRWTYERMLRHKMQASPEELEEFKTLWKVLLLETPHRDA